MPRRKLKASTIHKKEIVEFQISRFSVSEMQQCFRLIEWLLENVLCVYKVTSFLVTPYTDTLVTLNTHILTHKHTYSNNIVTNTITILLEYVCVCHLAFCHKPDYLPKQIERLKGWLRWIKNRFRQAIVINFECIENVSATKWNVSSGTWEFEEI